MSGHVFKLRMGTKPQKKATVLIPLISGHVFKQPERVNRSTTAGS